MTSDPQPGRLLVIIPAWNEQAVVATTVRETQAALPDADLLVVDDGSTDQTAQQARGAGATVLRLPGNLGVGGAMRAGYLYAAERGYECAVQLDADGQHDPTQVPVLLEAMSAAQADVVIGARFAGVGDYVATGPRRWAMRLLSRVLSRVTRTRLTDTTSGFKACSAAAIGVFSRDYPSEYLGDTVEALVIAARHRLRITQVGVSMRPRAGGRPSHSPLKAAIFLFRSMLALTVALTRPTIKAPAVGAGA